MASPPFPAGPVTAIRTTYLVVETRMAGLSLLPPSPSVWTPDFPRRRPPSPRNLPANPIRGTITTNFGAVVRGVRPPPTPFQELLLEMDTPTARVIAQPRILSFLHVLTFSHPLSPFPPLFLREFLVRCTSSISSFGETLSFTERESEGKGANWQWNDTFRG